MRYLIAGLIMLGLFVGACHDARRMRQAADTNARVQEIQRRLEACEMRGPK